MDKTSLKALSRFKNKQWLKEETADVRLGGLFRVFESDREDKCSTCKRLIYFTDGYEEIKDMVKKKHKILCPYCVLKSARPKDLNEEQREMINNLIERFEEKDGGTSAL